MSKAKKFIALLLSLMLILSTFAVGFGAFAADSNVAVVDADEEENETHQTFFSIFIEFFKEIGKFIKYIFYDLWLGNPAPDIPDAPTKYPAETSAAA